MSSNTFGTLLRLTTFGESHGHAVGGVLDGFPSNVSIDLGAVQKELDRRKPGQSDLTTPRKEDDRLEILSGLFEGISTGAPIAFIIPNKDNRSADYDQLKEVYRPSHADFTYEIKYGIRDHRGGGRSSARTMAPWVAAGAIAAQIIPGIGVTAYVSAVGGTETEKSYHLMDLSQVDASPVRCPDMDAASRMEAAIIKAKEEKDSLGGVITCLVHNCPPGLGEPQFSKLSADLAHAMFSINAVKGFELGGGFDMSRKRGSEVNDVFVKDEAGGVKTSSNNSGGIQGGISNGMDIVFRVAFKPVASIGRSQKTLDTAGKEISLETGGRHDPCVVPRAVPIVEAMTRLVLADHFLRHKVYR